MNRGDWEVIDLFAGPGGWDEGLRLLGVSRVLGFEKDKTACATGEAAGHARHLGDLSMLPPLRFCPTPGLVGSPPCPSFSTAGKGLGKLDMARILAHIDRIRRAGRWLHYSREGWQDERSALVLEPLRYALILRPDWIALEQVPPVLPIWQAIADVLRDHGWHVECGLLTAEQFGVAQTRKRAILAARWCPWHEDGASPRRMGELACPIGNLLPAPTHRKYRKGVDRAAGDQSLLPWVSMADALDLDQHGDWSLRSNYGTAGDPANRGTRTLDEPAPTVTGKVDRNLWMMRSSAMANAAIRSIDEPAATITAGHDRAERVWVMQGNQTPGGSTERQVRELDQPAMTLTSSVRSCRWIDIDKPATTVQGDRQIGALRVSVQEAAVLQSFRPDYPWQGPPTKQYLQIGNAIPPLLAAAVAGQLLGLPWQHLAPAMSGRP